MRKVILGVSFLLSTFSFAQNKLEKAKNDFKSKDTNTITYKTTYTDDSYSYTDDEGSLFNNLFLDLTLGLVYYVVIESPINADRAMYNAEMQPYPFYNKKDGLFTYNEEDSNFLKANISDSYFNSFDRIKANDLRLKLHLGNRFAINTNYIHFWEKTTENQIDSFDFASATIDYYRIRTTHFNFLWGAGVSYLGNDIKKVGLALNLGAELYFNPFSIEANYKYNYISDNSISLFEIGPKFHINRFYSQIKYQNYELATQDTKGILVGLGVNL